MALSFKDGETDRLARELSRVTGETLTAAVRRAIAERLERERRRHGDGRPLAERLDAIAADCAALPDRDTRSPDEIIGYDEAGVPR